MLEEICIITLLSLLYFMLTYNVYSNINLVPNGLIYLKFNTDTIDYIIFLTIKIKAINIFIDN